jgi:hypothetical protein
MIKKSVNDFIKQHFGKTKEPLMATHHYKTGIGYNFLLRVAMRGDFKGRKTPLFSADPKVTADQKVRYNKERYG